MKQKIVSEQRNSVDFSKSNPVLYSYYTHRGKNIFLLIFRPEKCSLNYIGSARYHLHEIDFLYSELFSQDLFSNPYQWSYLVSFYPTAHWLPKIFPHLEQKQKRQRSGILSTVASQSSTLAEGRGWQSHHNSGVL